MANKNRNNGTTRYDVIKLCCYIALVVGALIMFLNAMLRLFDANLGVFMNILTLIERIAFLIGVGLASYGFAASKGKKSAWFIIYVIAIVIFVVAMILWFF